MTTATLYPIRLATETSGKCGETGDLEPVVGRWYCAAVVKYDADRKEYYASFEQLGRYEGGDVFVDQTNAGGGYEPVDMGEFDYLQEQL